MGAKVLLPSVLPGNSPGTLGPLGGVEGRGQIWYLKQTLGSCTIPSPHYG